MLSFSDFFAACPGVWTTERTYHMLGQGIVERSYTEFRVTSLSENEKQGILKGAGIGQPTPEASHSLQTLAAFQWPGFAISFETRSETGEEVAMSLKALFVPATDLPSEVIAGNASPLPIAAQVPPDSTEVVRGFYLRDEGYSESGAIAGQFTYQPTRQTLEMTTYYRRSIALDQMRFVTPDLRMRTIITYQRPSLDNSDADPQVISLIGFGVEHRRASEV
ncbi:MAG: phycobiliprotein lyase [Leptolyngbyaceae cyanobacterium bins.59]|nr:phycobiliprotein lyase [Leptolyngbyaceae cyanobacterium bins.59]